MERDQRTKKKVNKRNNVDKFNENIGPLKKTKDKMKSEKPTPMLGVGVDVKTEPNLDVEFKKEPGFDNSLCDNESKNSLNMCSKQPNEGKNMKPGMMDLGNNLNNMVKMQDRPFIDSKSEITPRPEGSTEEEDLQSNLLSSEIKTENVSGDGNIFPPDSNENLILGLVNQTPTSGPGGTIEQSGSQMQPGVQPLPSNVINKQPGTMEAQYMQQQSQIFVFSTALANKAAECVVQGQYRSIIEYHCAQPGTKKYLEKHPLKLNQFNRPGPAQWLNSISQMKQKTGFPANSHMKNMSQMPRPMQGGMPGPCEMGNNSPNLGPGPGPRPLGPNMGGPMGDLEGMQESNDMPGVKMEMMDPRHPDFGKNVLHPMNMWNQGNMNQNNISCQGPMKPMDRDKPCVLNRPPMMDNMNPNNFPGVSQLTLTGTKVPTENLTPQQRQHREEQLAHINRMKQMLFPENQTQSTDEFGNQRMVPGGGNVNVTQNSDDINRNNSGDSNDMKSQIGLKSVNNASNNMNSPMGRNMNGQSGNNGPMESPMGFNNMVNPLVNPNNNSNNNSSSNNTSNNNSNVIDGTENSHAMQEQNPHMMQKNNFPGEGINAQMQWQKLCHQHSEDKKKKGSRTDSPAPRGCNKIQGPPPPYHQTARSASVPIAVPSPNPGSPSNTTSNLSLPSPRTSSDLNSPSDINKHSTSGGNNMKLNTCSPPNNQGSPACSKLMVNNPETPVSTSASQSPTPSSRKDANQPGLDFNNKDLFSRSVSSLTQQQKQHKQQNSTPSKEPNLMPVPSPQQIQYLNAFEGQELTIQKQPNTSLKESNMNSPLNHAPLAETPKCKTAGNSPLPPATENSPRFPNLVTSTSTTCTTPVSTQSQTSVPASKDTTTVPSSPDTSGPSPCKSDNLPLNPNNMNCPPNSKSIHFDPITSLAQMSQQLTNQSTPPCPGTGPMMSFNASSMHMVGNMNHMEPHVGGPVGPVGPMGHDNQNMENMPFVQNNPIISCAGPMMDMNPGFLNTSSPKPNMGNQAQCRVGPFFGNPNFPRMMGPGPGPGPGPNSYDGMNVQVKASTPNTIQYLPARGNTQNSNPNPRGPPSLDFLPQFPHPMNNMNSKVPFIPNCHSNSMDGVNPNNGGMNRGGPVGNSGGSIMSNSIPNMLLGGNMVLNPGPVGPLRGQIRPGPGGMMKVPPMGGGSPVFPPGPNCDPMVMGPGGNPNMFIQGSKSSPLGMPPDASQPLPPSMSQGNNFKNSPFVGGPTVNDPNYAQQFHNFQQQLYATNTRNHQLNSHMNQSYFMPK